MSPDRGLLDVLSRHGVPFVVIGGHAVNLHGVLRATEDTDLLWLRSGESETHLLGALTKLEARWIGDEIDPVTGIERLHPVTESFVRSQRLMMLCTRLGFLDLFDFVPGFPDESVAAVWQTALEVGGIRYVSLAWLRRLKQASGRPKDLLDLEQLPQEG